MFRELLRKKKQLNYAECIEILKSTKRGVLSVKGDGGYPYGMPMNHFYNDADGKLYFHCGKVGHRLDAIRADGKVSFCTYTEGYKNPDEWALNMKSVIVFGEITVVEDLQKIEEITTRLSLKFTEDEEYIREEIRLYAKNTLLLELTPHHICGKRIQES